MVTKREQNESGVVDPATDVADYHFRNRRLEELRRSRSRNPWHVVGAILFFAAAFVIVALGVREVDRRVTISLEPTRGAVPRNDVPGALPPADTRHASPITAAPTAPEARSRTLNTCENDAGEKLVTDMACPAGYRLATSRQFVPERVAPRPRVAAPMASERARHSPSFVQPQLDRASEEARRRCDAARASEADYRDRRGVKITYVELERLADEVRRACADV